MLVLRNEEYAILKWFAEFEGEMGAPGPRRARASTASRSRPGTGCARGASRASDELRQALAEAIASDAPELIEVTVAPGMSLG